MKKVLDFWSDLWYNNGMISNKMTTQDYIDYLSTINYFRELPLWKRQLYSYENRDHRPVITLPPSSMEAAHKALASLPPCNVYTKSCNIDDLDDFIWSIT